MTSTTDARHDIRQLRACYGHYLDRGDWEAWANLFAPDATVEFGSYRHLEDRDEIREFGESVVDDLFEFSMHTAQMPLIDVDDDTATGHWYLLVYYELSDGDPGWIYGTYDDEYRRVDDDWKFSYVTNEVAVDTGGMADRR